MIQLRTLQKGRTCALDAEANIFQFHKDSPTVSGAGVSSFLDDASDGEVSAEATMQRVASSDFKFERITCSYLNQELLAKERGEEEGDVVTGHLDRERDHVGSLVPSPLDDSWNEEPSKSTMSGGPSDDERKTQTLDDEQRWLSPLSPISAVDSMDDEYSVNAELSEMFSIFNQDLLVTPKVESKDERLSGCETLSDLSKESFEHAEQPRPVSTLSKLSNVPPLPLMPALRNTFSIPPEQSSSHTPSEQSTSRRLATRKVLFEQPASSQRSAQSMTSFVRSTLSDASIANRENEDLSAIGPPSEVGTDEISDDGWFPDFRGSVCDSDRLAELPMVSTATPKEEQKAMELAKRDNPGLFFHRICKVKGRIIQAKGLCGNSKSLNSFCLVKSIRSDQILRNIGMSNVTIGSGSPAWNASFEFEVPAEWGMVELLGLKFLVFEAKGHHPSPLGGDFFFGGADLDISDQIANRLIPYELELHGGDAPQGRGVFKQAKTRRSQIKIELQIFREYFQRPGTLGDQLMRSLRTYRKVETLYIKIYGLGALTRISHFSRLYVIVRVLFIDGKVREVLRSEDVEYPRLKFTSTVYLDFIARDQPMVVLFDVYENNHKHLGSGCLDMVHFGRNKQVVKLNIMEPLLENRFDQKGNRGRATDPGKVALKRDATRSWANAAADSGKAFLKRDVTRLLSTPNKAKESLLSRSMVATMNTLATVKQQITGTFVDEPNKPYLEVGVAAMWSDKPMPHYPLVIKPSYIKNEDDAGFAYEQWKKEPTPFKPPAVLKKRNVTRPLVLEATTRIMFVSGRVIGASELLNLDAIGKSDPYCIIEAVPKSKNSSDFHFVHRTQICMDTLAPEWDEHFNFQVPEAFDLHCLRFSVFDWDMLPFSQAAAGEPLGSANIDVSYLKNGEVLKGEVPLIGVRKRQGKAIFRRQSRIVFELRLERRIMPVLSNDDAAEATGVERHRLSRVPPSATYYNPSQDPVYHLKPRSIKRVEIENELRSPPKVTGHSTLERIFEVPMDVGEARPQWMPPHLRLGQATPGPEEVPPFVTTVDELVRIQLKKQEPSSLFDLDPRSFGPPARGDEDRRGPPLSFIKEHLRIRTQALMKEAPSPVYAAVGTTSLAAQTFVPGGLMERRLDLSHRPNRVTSDNFHRDIMRASELNAYKRFLTRPTPLVLNSREDKQEYGPQQRTERTMLPPIAFQQTMGGSRSLSASALSR